MIRSLLIAALIFGATFPAQAQGQPTKPDPMQQALVQMVQEAQSREAQALVQVYGLKAQVGALQAQLAEKSKDEPEKAK